MEQNYAVIATNKAGTHLVQVLARDPDPRVASVCMSAS